MSTVRINELARELEVKSKAILDALTEVGVTEKKTHSSSIEADEAERVRAYILRGRGGSSAQPRQEPEKPKIDWSRVSKPGDVAKAILERRNQQDAAHAAAPRPAAPVAAAPAAPARPAAPAAPAAPPKVAAPPAAAVPAAEEKPAPRRIVPQPRPAPAVVSAPPSAAQRTATPAPAVQTPAIASRPPAGPV